MKQLYKTDIINLVMMLLALVLAISFPFKTFLYSFAILGPLHYLTEINWLDEKEYFTTHNKSFKKIAVTATVIFIFPLLIKIGIIKNNISIPYINYIQLYSNGVLLALIGLSVGFLIWKKLYLSILTMLFFGSLIFIFNDSQTFITWLAVFIPTIVHVYIFTGMFMLYGALKTKSKIGLFNLLLLILIPFIINHLNIDPSHYHFSDSIKFIFTDNNFHILNSKVTNFIGKSDGNSFFFYEVIDLKIQIFIAFAYSYHYLNWFTKTTVIKWHQNFNRKKIVLIGSIWLASVGLYYFDFKSGFLILLFFSTLHVFVELPLNAKTFKGVIDELFHFK